MVRVLIPTTVEHLDHVRALMRAFIAWHRQRHLEDLALIDSYFDAAAFEAELAGLPGKYAPPHGRLLLAMVGDQPAGCVALREIDGTRCEMKRMFVYPHRRGQGVGRALAEAVIRVGGVERVPSVVGRPGPAPATAAGISPTLAHFARLHDPEGNPIELWEPRGRDAMR
jgi:GNAT superfamily N-acetyltransferase